MSGVLPPSPSPAKPGPVTICLACGATLEGMLERLGSLRCDACRDLDARLDPALVPEPDTNRQRGA
jgi:hypothetical protein